MLDGLRACDRLPRDAPAANTPLDSPSSRLVPSTRGNDHGGVGRCDNADDGSQTESTRYSEVGVFSNGGRCAGNRTPIARPGSQLAKDARFIASLPPVHGIVKARSGVEADDDEEVWQERVASIYTGLLRSNPNYLALSLLARAPEGSAEIVRVERNSSDRSFVRRLPQSRLYAAPADQLMNTAAMREPGDVKMSLDPRPRYADGAGQVQRLAVATPVYSDITGDCFGMALIEADISASIEEVLLGLGVHCEVFVLDGQGQLWATAHPKDGVHVATPGQTIENLPDQVASQMTDKGKPFDIEHEYEYIAKRFFVDPDGRGVAIFARLP